MRGYAPGTLSIASGSNTSSALDLRGITFFSIFLPTLDAGTVRLIGSYDGTNYFDMQDMTPVVLVFGSGTGNFVMDGDYCARFLGCAFVQVKTSVNQTAARTINYVTWRGT